MTEPSADGPSLQDLVAGGQAQKVILEGGERAELLALSFAALLVETRSQIRAMTDQRTRLHGSRVALERFLEDVEPVLLRESHGDVVVACQAARGWGWEAAGPELERLLAERINDPDVAARIVAQVTGDQDGPVFLDDPGRACPQPDPSGDAEGQAGARGHDGGVRDDRPLEGGQDGA